MVVDPTISYFGGLMNKPKFDPEALKALKTQRNLSAQAVSDLSGVPVSTVNRILRGEGEPNINAVAAFLGISRVAYENKKRRGSFSINEANKLCEKYRCSYAYLFSETPVPPAC